MDSILLAVPRSSRLAQKTGRRSRPPPGLIVKSQLEPLRRLGFSCVPPTHPLSSELFPALDTQLVHPTVCQTRQQRLVPVPQCVPESIMSVPRQLFSNFRPKKLSILICKS